MKIEKSTGTPNRRANSARTKAVTEKLLGSWRKNQTEARRFNSVDGQLVLTITGQD
jgi:hypothetical protein